MSKRRCRASRIPAGLIGLIIMLGSTASTANGSGPTYYYLVNKGSGMCLTVADGGQGRSIMQWPLEHKTYQMWELRRDTYGYVTMVSRYNNLAVNVNQESKMVGARVIQWPVSNRANEKWLLIGPDNEGYYTIRAKHSNLSLFINGSGKGAGAQQWYDGFFPNSKWRLVPVKENKAEPRKTIDITDSVIGILDSLLNKGSEGDKLTGLAEEFFDRGNYEAAEAMYRKALADYKRKLPGGHWRIAVAASDLGNCLMTMERYADAEPYLVDSFDLLKSKLGIRDRNTLKTLNLIIRLYDSAEEYAAAAEYRKLLP